MPPLLVLEPLLQSWLLEDIGRGDRTTQGLLLPKDSTAQARWVAKAPGVIAGLPLAARIFQLLTEKVNFVAVAAEGDWCESGQVVAKIDSSLDTLLTGERVALNIVMHLSGIATLTRKYVEQIADLPTQLVDTRKTTPGLRLLEKYATGIRTQMPYPLTIEVEAETIDQVEEALQHKADIIMLDNMPLEMMHHAVQIIRQHDSQIKIEASGNITLETIRDVAYTGVNYISSSGPITQSKWLDLSMRVETLT